MADVEYTQSASLGLLQLLHGQYGAQHCNAAKRTPLVKSPRCFALTAGRRIRLIIELWKGVIGDATHWGMPKQKKPMLNFI
jgi:hypothetical protein